MPLCINRPAIVDFGYASQLNEALRRISPFDFDIKLNIVVSRRENGYLTYTGEKAPPERDTGRLQAVSAVSSVDKLIAAREEDPWRLCCIFEARVDYRLDRGRGRTRRCR